MTDLPAIRNGYGAWDLTCGLSYDVITRLRNAPVCDVKGRINFYRLSVKIFDQLTRVMGQDVNT